MPGEEVPDEEVLFGEITDDKTVAEEGADAETGLQKAGPRDIALSIDDQLPRTFTFWLRRIRQVTDTDGTERAVRVSDALEKNYYQELVTRNTEKEYLEKARVKFDLRDRKSTRLNSSH